MKKLPEQVQYNRMRLRVIKAVSKAVDADPEAPSTMAFCAVVDTLLDIGIIMVGEERCVQAICDVVNRSIRKRHENNSV
jgi:hypothetical protein